MQTVIHFGIIFLRMQKYFDRFPIKSNATKKISSSKTNLFSSATLMCLPKIDNYFLFPISGINRNKLAVPYIDFELKSNTK